MPEETAGRSGLTYRGARTISPVPSATQAITAAFPDVWATQQVTCVMAIIRFPNGATASVWFIWVASLLGLYMACTSVCSGANKGSSHPMLNLYCRGYHGFIRPYVQLVGDRLEAGRRVVTCGAKLKGLSELLSLENEEAYVSKYVR